MAQQHLATYLNDHLAGSVVALELLEYLQKRHEKLRATLRGIADEVETDQRQLRRFLVDLGIEESSGRKALGWVTDKLARAKLWLDDMADGKLQTLEAIELISLGIEGKKALWTALAAAAEANSRLRILPYADLERRADDQRRRVEGIRLAAARSALADDAELEADGAIRPQ